MDGMDGGFMTFESQSIASVNVESPFKNFIFYMYWSQPISVKAEVGGARPPPAPCSISRASKSTDLWHHLG